jgi:hypothetical protein
MASAFFEFTDSDIYTDSEVLHQPASEPSRLQGSNFGIARSSSVRSGSPDKRLDPHNPPNHISESQSYKCQRTGVTVTVIVSRCSGWAAHQQGEGFTLAWFYSMI